MEKLNDSFMIASFEKAWNKNNMQIDTNRSAVKLNRIANTKENVRIRHRNTINS